MAVSPSLLCTTALPSIAVAVRVPGEREGTQRQIEGAACERMDQPRARIDRGRPRQQWECAGDQRLGHLRRPRGDPEPSQRADFRHHLRFVLDHCRASFHPTIGRE
jgi:hypothetical protein